MLKHEGYAVGTRIRGYDFEPYPGREGRYVEGVIEELVDVGYFAYAVRVDTDTCFPDKNSRVGLIVYVPFEVTFDYPERVSVAPLKVTFKKFFLAGLLKGCAVEECMHFVSWDAACEWAGSVTENLNVEYVILEMVNPLNGDVARF